MKGKTWAVEKAPRVFLPEQVFFFQEEMRLVIGYLSFIIEMGRRILSIPMLAKWKLTVVQGTTLFSVFVLFEVIAVCVTAFIPVLSLLYGLFLRLLKCKKSFGSEVKHLVIKMIWIKRTIGEQQTITLYSYLPWGL